MASNNMFYKKELPNPYDSQGNPISPNDEFKTGNLSQGTINPALDAGSYGGTLEGSAEGGAKIAQGGKLAQIGSLVANAVPGMAPSLPWLHIATIPEKYRTDIAINQHIEKEKEEKDAYGLSAIYKSIEDDKKRMGELGGDIDAVRQKQAALTRPEIPTDFKPSVGGGIAALLTGAKTGDFETALGNLKAETDQNQAIEYQNSMNKFADEGKNNGANLASLLKEYEITSNHKGDSEKNLADFNRVLMQQTEFNKRTDANNETKLDVQDAKNQGAATVAEIKADSTAEQIMMKANSERQSRFEGYLSLGMSQEDAMAQAVTDTGAKYGALWASAHQREAAAGLSEAKAKAIPEDQRIREKAINGVNANRKAILEQRERLFNKGWTQKFNLAKLQGNIGMKKALATADAAMERLIRKEDFDLSGVEMKSIESAITGLGKDKIEAGKQAAKARADLSKLYAKLGTKNGVQNKNEATAVLEKQIQDAQKFVGSVDTQLATYREAFGETLKQAQDAMDKAQQAIPPRGSSSPFDAAPAGGQTVQTAPVYDAVKEYIGTPYKFGGDSKAGIDCSAFTQQICGKLGAYNVPRTAREQFTQGKEVGQGEGQPGDLVFWSGTQKGLAPGVASHVAVYLGNGKMAQVGSKGVTIVDAATYKPTKNSQFLGVRRFEKGHRQVTPRDTRRFG